MVEDPITPPSDHYYSLLTHDKDKQLYSGNE
ncbi:hypothetical protein SHDE107825_01145 [Shewanella denitrificans]